MPRATHSALLMLILGLTGCAAANDQAGSATTSNRLATATVTFSTLDDGKDAKSAVSAQLLRTANELAADGTASGMAFNDNTTAPPVAMSIKGPFAKGDVQTGQLRLRLTPDGNDTWTFNVRLALQFADQTQQAYAWTGIRLDEQNPERTLLLAGAASP